jgi:hypothetical protein
MISLKKLRILIIIALAVFLAPMLAPAPHVAPATPRVSYNLPPGDVVHAPLSGMGLITLARAQGNFTGAVGLSSDLSLGSSGSNGRQNGLSSVRQNAVRFVNDTSYFPQTETTVAVDPANPDHVVGGFNDLKYFFCPTFASDCSSFPVSVSGFTVSSDGGDSILKGNDLPQLNVTSGSFQMIPAGDPTVVAGLDGSFFYGTLATSNYGGSGVILAKSNPSLFDPRVSCVSTIYNSLVNSCWTEVLVFGSPFFGGGGEDKPVIAIDGSSSAYSGSVYVGWDHFDLFTGLTSSYLARCSSDLSSCTMLSGGSVAVLSGIDQFADFTTPVVDANGNVYVTWCNYGTVSTFGPVTCRLRSSPPGGESFGPTSTVLSFMGAGTSLPNYSITQGFATEQFRTASIPYMAVDTSSKATTGNLYFTIQVCTSGRYLAVTNFFYGFDNPGLCGLSSIVFSRSTNGGLSWSSPVIVSRLGVNAQPTITVDPANGHLFVLYYTTQFDPFNHRIDVVASISTNGGETFHQIRVTSVSNEPDSDPNMYFYLGAFGGSWTVPQYGDYFTATALDGTLSVLFTANYAVEQGTFQTDPFLAVLERT